MTPFPIHHILFDLGGTLMHARADWAPVFVASDQALVADLRRHHIYLDPAAFRARLQQYYRQRDQDCQETTYHFVLHELLQNLGYSSPSEHILRSALSAMFAITQSNWQLEEDALPSLRHFRAIGCQLGIFSNAGDDGDVQALVDKFAIRPYFDFVLTSSASFYRKPHPRAFELALAHWNISPAEALMVGDNLTADILGAQSLGMAAVWLKRRAQVEPGELQHIHPHAELETLNQLPAILEQLNRRLA